MDRQEIRDRLTGAAAALALAMADRDAWESARAAVLADGWGRLAGLPEAVAVEDEELSGLLCLVARALVLVSQRGGLDPPWSAPMAEVLRPAEMIEHLVARGYAGRGHAGPYPVLLDRAGAMKVLDEVTKRAVAA